MPGSHFTGLRGARNTDCDYVWLIVMGAKAVQAEGSNQGDGAAFCAIAADARDVELGEFTLQNEIRVNLF